MSSPRSFALLTLSGDGSLTGLIVRTRRLDEMPDSFSLRAQFDEDAMRSWDGNDRYVNRGHRKPRRITLHRPANAMSKRAAEFD